MLRKLYPGLPDVVFGLVLASILVGGRYRLLNDPGTSWHLRLGRDIISSGYVPRTDSLTYTRLGQDWVDQSWLFDVLLAVLVKYGGWSLAGSLCAIVLAATYAALTRWMLLQGIAPGSTLLVAILAAGAGATHFLLRPHVVTIGFVLASFWLCQWQHEHGGWRVFWVVPLTALWANIHGGFLAGPLIVFCAGVGNLVSGPTGPTGRRQFRRFGVAFALCLLAGLATPYGAGLYRHVWGLLFGSGVTPLIEEYQPIPFGKPDARAVEWIVVGLVALPCLSARRMSRYELVHTIVWLHLALASVRHAPLFALAAAPGLGKILDGLRSSNLRNEPNALARRPTDDPRLAESQNEPNSLELCPSCARQRKESQNEPKPSVNRTPEKQIPKSQNEPNPSPGRTPPDPCIAKSQNEPNPAGCRASADLNIAKSQNEPNPTPGLRIAKLQNEPNRPQVTGSYRGLTESQNEPNSSPSGTPTDLHIAKSQNEPNPTPDRTPPDPRNAKSQNEPNPTPGRTPPGPRIAKLQNEPNPAGCRASADLTIAKSRNEPNPSACCAPAELTIAESQNEPNPSAGCTKHGQGVAFSQNEPNPAASWGVLPTLVSLLLILVALRDPSLFRFDPGHWPLAAISTLDSHPVDTPMFHEQDWGGLLEASGSRGRLAFIDDRFELFGRALVLDYLAALEGGPGWDAVRDAHAIGLVWVRPERGLARRLEKDAGWVERYRDGVSVLFARVGGADLAPGLTTRGP